MAYLLRFWTWLTDGHVVFTTPDVARYFLRCESCGRVFMHYWACKPANEPGRVGCPCGGIKCGQTRLPEWQAAYFVLTRYVVRKRMLGRTYWDPRMAERRAALDA